MEWISEKQKKMNEMFNNMGFKMPEPIVEPYDPNADNRTLDQVYSEPIEKPKEHKGTFGSMNKEAFAQGKDTFMYNGKKIATWDPVTGQPINSSYKIKENAKKVESDDNDALITYNEARKKIDGMIVEKDSMNKTANEMPDLSNKITEYPKGDNPAFTKIIEYPKGNNPIFNQQLKQQSLDMFYNIGKELGISKRDIQFALNKPFKPFSMRIRKQIASRMGDWGKGY